MKKKAYLSKFLVQIAIPPELAMDEELQQINGQHKELQAEFQVAHQTLEKIKSEAAAPNELKREINQLEQEKEQLLVKISKLKQRNSGNPEFNALLEMTSNLRKEQEEEAKFSEKMKEAKHQIEWNEQQMMITQQRLVDLSKTQAENVTAYDMLKIMRADVARSREMCIDRIGRELSDKQRKLEQ